MFDGIHVGHKEVLRVTRNAAHENECPMVIVSFVSHPQVVTARTPTPQLTTLDDRLELFEKQGVDIAILLNFSKEFSKISAEDYVKDFLIGALHARFITIGYDHRFGKEKRGSEFLLNELAGEYDFVLNVIPPISVDGQIVSSSIIRKMLKYGDVTIANRLLGREFMLRGEVVEGEQRGRTIGYPTANIKPKGNIIIPACGVYSVDVQIGKDPKRYPAVLNIGFCPTFVDIPIPTIEAHIIDFNQDIYNEKVAVYFKEKIRNEKKFESPQELVEQIKKDLDRILNKLKQAQIQMS